MRKRLLQQWQVGPCSAADAEPTEWVPAVVPGAVQLDWAKARGWEPVEWVGNVDDYQWMADSYWRYRCTLDFSETGDVAWLVFEGIDHSWTVLLNGQPVLNGTGMFETHQWQLTGRARPGDTIDVVIAPAPARADSCVRPAVEYGWDFRPRLLTSGLWAPAYVETRPASHICWMQTDVELDPDHHSAKIRLEVGPTWPFAGLVAYRLYDPDGALVLQGQEEADPELTSVSATLRVADPVLWWPAGMGAPALYLLEINLVDETGDFQESWSRKIGIRSVALTMGDLWIDTDQDGFPKGPHKAPMTLEVNGRRVFAKGTNWAPTDLFPGRSDPELTRRLLQFAFEANMNLIRCWGGAAPPSDSFYEFCDEHGMMVWQEFPLACNRYEGTAEYLRELRDASEAIILRLRHHPSLVIWCGGNELFNDWSRMTPQDAAIRLLARTTYDLDPSRPFLPTAPLHGMGHGSYEFRTEDERDLIEAFQTYHCTAYTEFGVPGPAPVETLRRIIPEADQFPPSRSPAWLLRHAYESWSDPSWLFWEEICRTLGEPQTLDDMVEKGWLLQAEGLRFAFEEARRQSPWCSMALNWCFAEPWPCAANNSLIAWPEQPKPAYRAVRQALRPILASARYPRFDYQTGDSIEVELWLLNDSADPAPACLIEAWFGNQIIFTWDCPESQGNVRGPKHEVPAEVAGLQRFEIKVVGLPEWDSAYTVLVRDRGPD